MPVRPDIVCICGSSRFVAEMSDANRDLTLQGVIVLAPGEMEGAVSAEQKAVLDALHRHKIDLADRVLVVNPGGYIGASTAAEIAYAQAAGTPVSFTDPPVDAAGTMSAEP
ncbi:MAG: hypothetical protein BGN98_02085 [Microbacterium sp. 69-7]|uniref:hypothetical protein n=1 Tax=unclassified Microbacterium TaxID=2609290 RepID=UPI00044B00DA|nr:MULTISPECIES: hypothetical protein [unclassified Microbacterium]EXJ50537.1 hypothetical protein AS96_14200 [Microbacterium sp. MRS-1]OJU44602.1 MAG: hypothetical protein BGN98_02085 [Microbacterium sp. 69-7]